MRESWENAAAIAGLPSLLMGTHLHLGQIKTATPGAVGVAGSEAAVAVPGVPGGS